jgi:ATP adenylyltransferase
MEHLWSPWRSAYVSGTKDRDDEGCFLCAAADPASDARTAHRVALTDGAVVVLNRYPYNAGHLLIAPTRHVATLTDLSNTEAHHLMDIVRNAARAVELCMRPHGMNIGVNQGTAGGAGVPGHLHVHIVPRWTGDSNFMPVVAETKVISETLDTMWERFLGAFQEVAPR